MNGMIPPQISRLKIYHLLVFSTGEVQGDFLWMIVITAPEHP